MLNRVEKYEFNGPMIAFAMTIVIMMTTSMIISLALLMVDVNSQSLPGGGRSRGVIIGGDLDINPHFVQILRASMEILSQSIGILSTTQLMSRGASISLLVFVVRKTC